ncbi:hypothetical protein [Treponema sp.]|uniref:hypothetical protein n=1 Tax=Treponema sp. TaxID=166 RepID=UPI0025CE23B0|nr:hypothetical protein [Treponema sp.]MBR4322710.1 hypothetical protein [Treponema sp.]
MPYVLLGMLIVFVPARCVVGCAIDKVVSEVTENSYDAGYKNGEKAEYFYYEGPIHELDSAYGKEKGMLSAKTTLCHLVKSNTYYKLEKGVPVKTYISVGDSAGTQSLYNVGEKRNFFLFLGFSHESIPEENISAFKKWDDIFSKAQSKAISDAEDFFNQKFNDVTISEHVVDDFAGKFRESIKGCYELKRNENTSKKLPKSVLNDKSKIYYLSEQEYKKLEKIKEAVNNLFLDQYENYCNPLPVYATTGMQHTKPIKYPFDIVKL